MASAGGLWRMKRNPAAQRTTKSWLVLVSPPSGGAIPQLCSGKHAIPTIPLQLLSEVSFLNQDTV
jgi:hypothetical protein